MSLHNVMGQAYVKPQRLGREELEVVADVTSGAADGGNDLNRNLVNEPRI